MVDSFQHNQVFMFALLFYLACVDKRMDLSDS